MNRFFVGCVLVVAASEASGARAADNFSYEGNCSASSSNSARVRNGWNGLDIKPSLNAIAQAAGKRIQVYSCYRSPERQAAIREAHGCNRPRANCSQSVALHSAHTYNIAADLKMFASDTRRQCQFIAQGRSKAGAGLGGVGTYPAGDGHFDMGRSRSWNKCRGVVTGDLGYRSQAVRDYLSKSASRPQCAPSQSFPNCCGPIRRMHGLCTG